MSKRGVEKKMGRKGEDESEGKLKGKRGEEKRMETGKGRKEGGQGWKEGSREGGGGGGGLISGV